MNPRRVRGWSLASSSEDGKSMDALTRRLLPISFGKDGGIVCAHGKPWGKTRVRQFGPYLLRALEA